MQHPTNLLKLMIAQDAFRVCRLMRTHEFLTYCRERGLSVERDRLRQLERIGVFRPLVRAYRPDVVSKIETVEGGYRDLGFLDDGEVWTGETRTELAEFDPTTKWASVWMDEGLLWSPGQGQWEHEKTIDSERDRHEAYYSRFQIYPLDHVLSALTLSVQLEWAVQADGSANPKFSPGLRKRASDWAQQTAMAMRAPRNDDIDAVLCQIIANRFYFKTQSDGRRMTISQYHNWDWGAYVRAWTPSAIVDAFAIAEEESRRVYETLDIAWFHGDPLGNWYNLVRFVSINKRKRLKGDALKALALREMAHMYRLFHEEAFGTKLTPLGEVGVQVIKRIPDIDAEVDPLRALELTANDFGVNAKPQLVLFVEGLTEQTAIPRVFEQLFGSQTERYGIEVLGLGGVGNAAGGKEAPFSALWRLVDYLHHHQTLAFVLLDNEGLAARNVAKGLPKAPSVHSPDRKATRLDHIKVWKACFEFDNFSDTELATALNRLADRRIVERSDIAESRAAVRAGPTKRQKLLTIDRLFEQRTGKSLDKPRLGALLVGMMFDPATRRKPESRPIAQFLVRVEKKAARNHQPITQEDWQRNQRSGYVGTLQPAALREHRRRIDRKRRARSRAQSRRQR